MLNKEKVHLVFFLHKVIEQGALKNVTAAFLLSY